MMPYCTRRSIRTTKPLDSVRQNKCPHALMIRKRHMAPGTDTPGSGVMLLMPDPWPTPALEEIAA